MFAYLMLFLLMMIHHCSSFCNVISSPIYPLELTLSWKMEYTKQHQQKQRGTGTRQQVCKKLQTHNLSAIEDAAVVFLHNFIK